MPVEHGDNIKKVVYKLVQIVYKAVYKCSLKKNHKIKILRNIFTYEPWSWRVVGISKKALREFAKNNFNYKTGTFNRDHCFQPAATTMKEMLKKFMSYEEWWTWVWNNDKTVLVTITEHNKKSYKFKDDIIPIDWKLGYFQCAEAIGFKYRKKNEGKFLERLAEEYNIK